MIITHNEFGGYEIHVDESNFVVKRFVNTTLNKQGDEVNNYSNHGYFISLEMAIKRIIKLRMLAENSSSIKLEEYIKQYKELVDKLVFV